MTASEPNVRAVVVDALVAMVSGVTGMVPPTDTPLPDFIQGPVDRAVSKIEAARAADKARIAELEKERDEWHRLFDSAGQLSKNACDDLNSAKSRIAELVLSLRTVVGMLHHRATTPLERQAIRIAETALAQQGKEGEA